MEAAQFLRDLITAVPYRIHTVLADHDVQFTPRKQDIWDIQHIFDRGCDEPCSGCAAAPSGIAQRWHRASPHQGEPPPPAGSCLRSLQEMVDGLPVRFF